MSSNIMDRATLLENAADWIKKLVVENHEISMRSPKWETSIQMSKDLKHLAAALRPEEQSQPQEQAHMPTELSPHESRLFTAGLVAVDIALNNLADSDYPLQCGRNAVKELRDYREDIAKDIINVLGSEGVLVEEGEGE